MKAYVHGPLFMWNLSASVGKMGQNSDPADVSFLQWYYTLASEHPETPPDRKEVYKNVKITGMCTGRDDDPLVKAIVIHQRGLNHPIVDGRASPIPGTSGDVRVGGDKAFFVIRLGARLAFMFPQQWPRLDHMPRCPNVVAAAVKEAIPQLE